MLSPCIALQGDFLWQDLRSRCAPLHFPPTSPVGPVQHGRREAEAAYTLRDFVTAFRHPSPPAAGRCK